uniref:Poly [ADP-ribose] polymerase n=1 Tax=Eptatretus burgeri TaxID=7764 RepID=A0A8C4N0Q4_EPTBU
ILIDLAKEKEEDLENLYKKHDCMGKIDDPNSVQHLDSKRYRANLRSGHTVSVSFGNLLYQPGDVLVNAANGELRHIGGLAKAISDAAGPVVQKECDAHVQKHGKLTEGEVFVSSSGRLSCKKIIHAVGPRWNSHSSKVAVGLLFHAVTNCLKEAEKGQYKSIVFPAISGGIFAFPIRECSQTIVDAIVAYCEDVSNSQHTLKDIHIVDLNDKVVSALKDALQVKLGQKASVGKKASQHYPGIKLPSGSDVIVNSLSGSMQLNEGKLSNSILQKAGPHLQAVFDQTVHNFSMSAKQVIQTPAEGNLKCKEIYHVPLQTWVKDRPISGKVCAIGKCINIGCILFCNISISFPALGSGHLSYPAHLTATFMLREVLRFCDEQVPTSITDVRFVLHPQDDLILKVTIGYILSSRSWTFLFIYLFIYLFIIIIILPGKVFAWIILHRIRHHLLEHQHQKQSGFTPNKSMIDRILALRVLTECIREFRQGLHAACVDLSKAFDSENRDALWKFLGLRGMPPKLINLMSELYSGTESAVRCGDTISDLFRVVTGVLHGCLRSHKANLRKFNRNAVFILSAIQFGKGTYFAVNAAYSAQQRYSPPDINGNRYIFQALVATGDFCQGNSKLIAPPPKGNSEQNVMYDSLVDNVQNPGIFVIFRDDQHARLTQTNGSPVFCNAM